MIQTLRGILILVYQEEVGIERHSVAWEVNPCLSNSMILIHTTASPVKAWGKKKRQKQPALHQILTSINTVPYISRSSLFFLQFTVDHVYDF